MHADLVPRRDHAPLFVGIEVDAVRETIWGLWWVVIGIVLLSYRPPSEG